MRGSKYILSGLVLGASLWGAAMGAPAATPANAPAAPAAPAVADVDCQKLGGEVSALIDKGTRLPNISAARAAFQVGIMECMEGDDAAANKHYLDAKKLLSDSQQKAPDSSPKAKQAG